MPAIQLSDEEKQRYRQTLLAKGQKVAAALAKVMAGRPLSLVELADLKGGGGRKNRDRLRAFLDDLTDRRKALDADDGTFGVCRACGGPISVAELDEMAWATECLGCGGG